MRKLLLPLALTAAGFTFAADIEVHGDVNLDYGSYFDKDFSPINAANQDIDLSLQANLDENIHIVVNANTHSSFVNANGKLEASEVRHGFAHSTAISDGDNRYTAFNFDGAQLRWDVSHDVTLIFGDMTYNAGAFNYYFWRDPSKNAVIVRDETLRGFGAEFGNEKYGSGKFYMGASEDNDYSLTMFVTYSLPLLNRPDEHLILTPSVDWMFGSDIGRNYTYVLGLEVDYSKSFETFNYGIYAVWGLHPYKGNGVHSFLLEPSMNYGVFNLGATFFYTITDSDYETEPQLFTEDQMLFGIEPSFNLHKKYTMGFAYEYHDRDTETDDNSFHFLGMNHYLYPTMKTEVVFWYGYNFNKHDFGPYVDRNFALGMSVKASF